MSDVHNIHEYAFAKQMVVEIPAAAAALQKCMDDLYPHRAFNAVCNAILEIQTGMISLQSNLSYFEKIVEKKGEI